MTRLLILSCPAVLSTFACLVVEVGPKNYLLPWLGFFLGLVCDALVQQPYTARDVSIRSWLTAAKFLIILATAIVAPFGVIR